MQDGYYKVRLKAKSGLSRIDICLDYIATTLWNGVEYWGAKGAEETYKKIGEWALSVTTHSARKYFDLVVIFNNDNVDEFWYVDGRGTIKKVFD